ncbi:Palmitoyltransferase [Aphelenchoides besseyi]|nr:Palmitoyltransferase [Aphelenchoides besseyi]KAI6229192.1 Palmitoyltransferase [Aphelenchoides besseyi]
MLRFRISLCDCSSLCYRFGNWIEQGPVLFYLDFFIRRILGKILVVFVYGLLTFFTFMIVTIVLPFETLHKPKWMIYVLCVMAVYFILNIMFYYYKSCRTPPGSPKKRSGVPFCYRCQNYKPINAHHCSICQICVLNMDHHCIWINQCVGAENHRYFLQFIGYLTTGSIIFVIVSWTTFHRNYWAISSSLSFCGLQELTYLPWRDSFCVNGMEFVSTAIFFSYVLSIVVFALVGGLFWWNVSLISTGQTQIDFLKNGAERGCFRQFIWPFDATNFRSNWSQFLGLQNGRRTFCRHILLPSSHRSYFEDDDKLELQVV